MSTLSRGENNGDPIASLRGMIARIRKVVQRHKGKIRENMLVAGPTEWLGIRSAKRTGPHSLYRFECRWRWPDGTIVASESSMTTRAGRQSPRLSHPGQFGGHFHRAKSFE